MPRLLLAAILCMGIISCGKNAPTSEVESATVPNTELANAQFQLAKNYLASDSPEKALSYLEASLANNTTKRAKALLTKTLTKNRFTVPIFRLDHPFPVTRFLENSDSVFVATGGKYPTLIRWKLSPEPKIEAILFPAESSIISHLSLSPNAKHLLIHRGKTNLLCDAETLKPILDLGTFPQNLDPEKLQPFSQNSLLLAHPVQTQHSLLWYIRDVATGESLRSEKFPIYPAPVAAHFEDTTLVISFQDETEHYIPIVGDIMKKKSDTAKKRIVPPRPSDTFFIEGNSLIHQELIPFTEDSDIDLSLLSGYSLDKDSQTLTELPVPDRLAALSKAFPGKIPATFSIFTSKREIDTRLASAFPEAFPELAAAQIAHAGIVWQTFASGDPAAISALFSALPPDGLPTATAIFLALKSRNPDFIEQAFAIARNVPQAILQMRSGTYAVTAEEFAAQRQEQDWIGYESPDFTPLIAEYEAEEAGALKNLRLGDKPTPEEIKAFITYLLSPETVNLLGAERLSNTAIFAAGKLAHSEENATSAMQLAAVAQRLGAHESALLRINATALTSLGKFEDAHKTWLNLITYQPEANHLASDYSEAAHTAFENANAEQAMEILNTGIFRFPNDVAFAIRAGWIALLTNHPTEAAAFLKQSVKLGLPPNEIENTTALLAIAHTQLGETDTAYAYLAQLKAINEKWGDPETIEAMDWPEPLKASLRQLVWIP